MVLEVGSGAGRFTNVVMRETKAVLGSIDYSGAVEANFKNNGLFAKEGRLRLAQASIYEMPFPENYFEKVFCFGVLQHTPDFKESLFALYAKTKPGGELVVDFYPIKGWWTKLHSKYLLRPITKKMSHEKFLRAIETITPAMITTSKFLHYFGLGALTRLLPVCDIKNTLPHNLNKEELREHVTLDTFDMFSPAYDNPQRIETVVKWLREAGAEVRFADFVHFNNASAAVVRCMKPE